MRSQVWKEGERTFQADRSAVKAQEQTVVAGMSGNREPSMEGD